MKNCRDHNIDESKTRKDMEFAATPIVRSNLDLRGNELYIKREDLIPYSFGGNKVRIAKEYFDHMLRCGSTCMIGYGNTRSNLVRALAWITRLNQVGCYIVSPSDDNETRISTNNEKIARASGAVIVPCTKSDVSKCFKNTMDALSIQGEKPYYIHGDMYGNGNEEIPLPAYEKVYYEIVNQQAENMLQFDMIFLACGTGMTQAGLLVGKYFSSSSNSIIGVSIARDAATAISKIRNMLKIYEGSTGKSNSEDWIAENLNVVDEYRAGGYGMCNEDILDCISSVLVLDGMPLDTTYTGKAFWGMTRYIEQHSIRGKKVLFIHTGGLPLFFDNIDLIGEGSM